MTKHTRGATEAAWVIMAGKAKIETEFGKKTLEGIADLIDRKTAAPELLEALKHAHTSLRTFSDHVPDDEKGWTSYDSEVLTSLEAAIAKAEEV